MSTTPRKEEKLPSVKIIFIPNFPKDEELKALVSLIITKPFREPQRDLLGLNPSWPKAYKQFLDELQLRIKDGDEFARHKLKQMISSQKSNCHTYKQEYIQEMKQSNVHLITIDWPGLVLMADLDVAKRHGLEQGLLNCCWNCGTTTVKLAHCSRCQKARYCSPNCQRDAWWHHKTTTSKKYGCT